MTWFRFALHGSITRLPVVALLVAGCSDTSGEHQTFGPDQIARSSRGMVVTAAPLATDAGVALLRAGGNAVDAAVAAAFALAVVEPTMSGLGGRTQVLLRTTDGRYVGIDGTTEVPARLPARGPTIDTTEDGGSYGYGTIAIPGTVAALTLALAEHGSKPLAEVMAPAIALAESGFTLPEAEAARIAEQVHLLRQFAGSRRHFLKPDGTPFGGGERFRQPELARVLRAIAREGATVFYQGWIADSIHVDMAAGGGYVSGADLAAYTAVPVEVVRGSYRGFGLVGTWLPASGATSIEALHILEQFDLAERAGGTEWAALTAQALLLSFEDRPRESAATVTSKTWAAERAGEVRDPRAAVTTASVDVDPSWHDAEPAHTTHLSVADRDGMVVALTQSLGPAAGSRVATAGLGFLHAATMGYLGRLDSGERPFTSQSPLIVERDGRPVLVLGAAGARRIISAVVEVTSRAIDEHLPLTAAMAAPRFHPTPDTVYLERRTTAAWHESTLEELTAFGFGVATRSSAAYFARLHAIAFDTTTREWVGVADSRWNGSAAGVR